jgi:hypothetical protein
MELDDLKQILNDSIVAQTETKSDEAIQSMMNVRAKNLMSKLQHSLIIEIVLCYLSVFVIGSLILFTGDTYTAWYFGIFGSLILLFAFILIFLLRRIRRQNLSDLPVRDNLERLHNLLDQFVRRYFQLTMLLIPVCLLVSFFVILSNSRYGGFDNKNMMILIRLMSGQTWVLFFCTALIFTAVSYLFTRWYLRKLYGNHLKDLKQVISELNDEPEDESA